MHRQDTQCFDGIPVTWSVSKNTNVFEPTKRRKYEELVAKFQEVNNELNSLRAKDDQLQEENRHLTQQNNELYRNLQMSKSDNEKLKEEIEEKNKRSNESKREKVKLVKRTRQLEALVSELYQLLSSQDVTMKKITHLSRRSSSNIRHTVSSIEDVEKDVGNAQLRSIRTSEKSATVKDPRIKSMLDKSAPKMRHTIVRSENVEKDVTDAQLRGIPPTEVFTAFKDPSIKSFIEKLGGTCKKTVIGNESEESTTEEFGNLIPQFTETSNTPTTESDEQLTETSGTQLEQNRLSNQRQLNISNVANISIVMHDN